MRLILWNTTLNNLCNIKKFCLVVVAYFPPNNYLRTVTLMIPPSPPPLAKQPDLIFCLVFFLPLLFVPPLTLPLPSPAHWMILH